MSVIHLKTDEKTSSTFKIAENSITGQNKMKNALSELFNQKIIMISAFSLLVSLSMFNLFLMPAAYS